MSKFLYLLLVWLFPLLSFSQIIRIHTNALHEQVSFGIKKIKEATKGKTGLVLEENAVNKNAPLLSIEIITDSTKAKEIIQTNKWSTVKSFGAQCYSIRIKKGVKNKQIYVLAGGATGGMYGALDIAEAIECNTLSELKESENVPYLTKKGN